MSEYFATITKLRVPCPQVLYSLVEVGNYVMYKLLLPPKFPLPLLADFSVYLAPAQVLLNVCSGHVCGRDDIYLLLPVELGAPWEHGGPWFSSQLCSRLLGKVTSVFLHDVKCCG